MFSTEGKTRKNDGISYKLLGYTEYGKFLPAIERAKESFKNSGQNIDDHFAGVSDMITIATGTPKETQRSVENYSLSRYSGYVKLRYYHEIPFLDYPSKMQYLHHRKSNFSIGVSSFFSPELCELTAKTKNSRATKLDIIH